VILHELVEDDEDSGADTFEWGVYVMKYNGFC